MLKEMRSRLKRSLLFRIYFTHPKQHYPIIWGLSLGVFVVALVIATVSFESAFRGAPSGANLRTTKGVLSTIKKTRTGSAIGVLTASGKEVFFPNKGGDLPFYNTKQLFQNRLGEEVTLQWRYRMNILPYRSVWDIRIGDDVYMDLQKQIYKHKKKRPVFVTMFLVAVVPLIVCLVYPCIVYILHSNNHKEKLR